MSTPRIRLLANASIAFVVVAVSIAGACGDDDDNTEGRTSTSTERPDTTTTEPAGTDPSEVEPHIANLLARYDDVTNAIVADPSVANDRNNPLTADYLSLVEPNSAAEGAVQTWIDNSAQGITVRPYSDAAPAQATSLDSEIQTVSDDEVTFAICVAQNYRQFDGQGRETEFVTGQSVPGEGSAVRVEGRWRLRRIEIASNVVGCGGGEA